MSAERWDVKLEVVWSGGEGLTTYAGGSTAEWVTQFAPSHSRQGNPVGKVYDPQTRADIRRLHHMGMSLGCLVRTYGMTRKTIKRIVGL